MNYQEVILYKSARAYYNIRQEGRNRVVAELQQYDGSREHMPPRKVVYMKKSTAYQPSLLDDVCKAMGKRV